MLKHHKLFLFDMDGTIYIGNQLFDFTKELLATLREKGCRYLFVTNNSSKSVDAYIEKLANFGIDVTEEEFVTSSQATAYYLKQHHKDDKLYVCGTDSLKKELLKNGFVITENLDEVDCIVMGYDTELTYKKLEDVCKLLFANENIPYIATHPDYKCITEFGSVPDLGSVCDMIYNATGKRPMIIGKPNSLIPELAMKKCGCTKEETVFIGDQMDTDLLCGLNSGVTTILVMTGETTRKMVEASESKPHILLNNAGEILPMLFGDEMDYKKIPEMSVEGAEAEAYSPCGPNIFQKIVKGTTLADYQTYLATLEEEGFVKYVDNGLTGLESSVWNATYTKGNLVLTVMQMVRRNRTYITIGQNIPLSKHLFYRKEYVADNREGAKTKVHMPELHTYGNSFIIQLKNGHFILDDGGMPADTRYLLDYLETLVPQGEKPVIEGWFLSHGHGDHTGPLIIFEEEPEIAKRLYVEGVYFSEPADSGETVLQAVHGISSCRTSSGEVTPHYRQQTGQRYYFNDITIDVLHTQEQIAREDYANKNLNDGSTWLLYTIEGQRFLHGGDAGRGSIEIVKNTYEQEYLNFDVMATFHHGQNIYDSFVDYFNYKTVLYTTFLIGSQTANWHTEDNKRMQERATECLSWGDGTKILTFPYKVGTAESLPKREWIYHPDRNEPKLY